MLRLLVVVVRLTFVATNEQLELPLQVVLELGPLLDMALLDLQNGALPRINLIYQLVFQMDHAPLELLQFEPVLPLYFLLGNLE